jgi:hypothetical protein
MTGKKMRGTTILCNKWRHETHDTLLRKGREGHTPNGEIVVRLKNAGVGTLVS